MISETLQMSRERVSHVIYNVLDMRKLSAKWIPKCLNADQKWERVAASKSILDQFKANSQHFLSPWTKRGYITMILRPKNG